MTLSTFSYQKALCHKINASVKKALEKFSAQKKKHWKNSALKRKVSQKMTLEHDTLYFLIPKSAVS
jgi:type III secretory pathway component EscR